MFLRLFFVVKFANTRIWLFRRSDPPWGLLDQRSETHIYPSTSRIRSTGVLTAHVHAIDMSTVRLVDIFGALSTTFRRLWRNFAVLDHIFWRASCTAAHARAFGHRFESDISGIHAVLAIPATVLCYATSMNAVIWYWLTWEIRAATLKSTCTLRQPANFLVVQGWVSGVFHAKLKMEMCERRSQSSKPICLLKRAPFSLSVFLVCGV